jgi:hypothetical protein
MYHNQRSYRAGQRQTSYDQSSPDAQSPSHPSWPPGHSPEPVPGSYQYQTSPQPVIGDPNPFQPNFATYPVYQADTQLAQPPGPMRSSSHHVNPMVSPRAYNYPDMNSRTQSRPVNEHYSIRPKNKMDGWALRAYTYADYLESETVLVYKFFDPVTEQDKYGLVEQDASRENCNLRCLLDDAEAGRWVKKIPLRGMSQHQRTDLLMRCTFTALTPEMSFLEEIGVQKIISYQCRSETVFYILNILSIQ